MHTVVKLLATFIVTSLAGCVLLQKPKVIEVYLLEPKIAATSSSTPRLPARTSIVVDQIETTRLLKGNTIIFGRDPLTRGKYQYSEWETPVPIRLQKIIANALQASNQFSQVVENEMLGLPAWKLKLELVDFYHDAQEIPGHVVISVRSTLISPKRASTPTHGLFQIRRPAHSFDAHGAVLSINEALAEMVPEIVGWTVAKIQNPG